MAYGFDNDEYRQLLEMLGRAGGGNLMGAPAANVGVPVAPQPQAMPPGMAPRATPYDQQLAELQDNRMDMGKLIPALALMNIGTALQTRKDLRPAVLAQLPGTILNAYKAQGEAAKERALMSLKVKYLDKQTKPDYGSEYFTNVNTGETKLFQKGESISPDWVRTKEPAEKAFTLQSRYNPDTGLEEKGYMVPGTDKFVVVGGQKAEKPEKDLRERTQIVEMVDPSDPNKTMLFSVNKDTLEKTPIGTKKTGSMLTDEGALVNAKNYVLGNKTLTSMRSDDRAKVSNLVGEAGFNSGELADFQSRNKMLTTGRVRLEGQRALIEAFANNTSLNLELANKMSEGVQRVGSPAANKWLLWFKSKALGQEVPMDNDIAAFNAIVGPTANEYAKVTSSATGAGVTSDAARHEMADILGMALNKSQFKNVSAAIQQELANRKKGYAMEHAEITSKLYELGEQVDKRFNTIPRFQGSPSLAPRQVQGPAATHQTGGDLKAQAAQRQERINAMPAGPQKEAAQRALDKVLGGL